MPLTRSMTKRLVLQSKMPVTRSMTKRLGQHSHTSLDLTRELNCKARPRIRRAVTQKMISDPSPAQPIDVKMPEEMEDGRGRELFEPTNDPLLNDVVMMKVLDYVEGTDLKTCRLVCQKWNRLTLPFTRSRLWAMIGCSQGTEWSMESFVKLMENSNRLGFESPFGLFCISCLDRTPHKIVLRFSQLCQPYVQEYILCGDELNQMTLSTLLKSAPNLTTLTVPCNLSVKNKKHMKLFPIEAQKPRLKFLKTLRVGNIGDTPMEGNNCPTYFDELFGVAPSITTLSLELSNIDTDLKVLNGLLKFGKVELIQNLTLGRVTVKHLELIQKMNGLNLKLKHLDLRTYVEDKYFDWCELLQLFKESLISLRISAGYSSFIFPRMAKLKELKIFGDCQNRLGCFGNQCFNTTFPSLLKLNLCYPNESNPSLYNDFLIPGWTPSTVKSLVLQNYPKMNIVFLHHIQTTFNFSTLRMLECEIDRDGEVMRQIWTHMTQLEGLYVYGGLDESMDSLVTGIPMDEINQMENLNHTFKLLEKMNKKDRENKILTLTTQHCKLPSIQNLRNLKFLRLNLWTRQRRSGNRLHSNDMTDLSGYLGFYPLNNLQHLYIRFGRISDVCVQLLEKDKCLMTHTI